MFDRLTTHAKDSLRHAREAAEKSGQDFLSPEHMLHGVLSVGECGATRILVASGIAPAAMLQGLSRRMPAAAEPLAPAMFPFTPKAKLVLEGALKELPGMLESERNTCSWPFPIRHPQSSPRS